MRFLPLIWRAAWRKKWRTVFTLGGIVAAFALFGFLQAVNVAFSMGVDLAGADRLVVIHRMSLIQPLPLSYLGRIEALPGVAAVVHASWFGGYYQQGRNVFAQFPVEPESYLAMFPEFLLPEEERQAWFADRTAAIAGRALADAYGWKVGDRIPLQATIWTQAAGARTWEFNLVGIYDGTERGTDTSQFLFHYEYFNEARALGKDLVGWYTVRVDDPARAPELAEAIDALFANSPAETRTSTEKTFVQGFANQVGDIGLIVRAIVGAVFFILLIVLGNAMAQSVRERTSELAVLKAVGFSDGRVLGLVLAESLLLALAGGAAGLAVAEVVVRGAGREMARILPVFYLPTGAVVAGVLLAAALGVVAGALPAVQAMRLSVVDALRRA